MFIFIFVEFQWFVYEEWIKNISVYQYYYTLLIFLSSNLLKARKKDVITVDREWMNVACNRKIYLSFRSFFFRRKDRRILLMNSVKNMTVYYIDQSQEKELGRARYMCKKSIFSKGTINTIQWINWHNYHAYFFLFYTSPIYEKKIHIDHFMQS